MMDMGISHQNSSLSTGREIAGSCPVFFFKKNVLTKISLLNIISHELYYTSRKM